MNDQVIEKAKAAASGNFQDWAEKIVKTAVSLTANVKESHIQLETELTDLGLDSLDVVEVVMEIEDLSDLEIPDEEVDNFNVSEMTISTLVDLVVKIAKG